MRLNPVLIILCISFSPSYAQKEWQKLRTEDGITVWTKQTEGSEVRMFRAQVIYPEKSSTIRKALRDVEQMHTWYDRVKSVKTLERINEEEAVYLLEYQLPLPFKNRYATLKGSMVYHPDKKLTIVETIHHPVNRPDIPKSLPMITRVKSRWELTENTDGSTTVVHEGYLDPEGNVPLWAINKDVEEAPFKTLTALRKKLKNYR